MKYDAFLIHMLIGLTIGVIIGAVLCSEGKIKKVVFECEEGFEPVEKHIGIALEHRCEPITTTFNYCDLCKEVSGGGGR